MTEEQLKQNAYGYTYTNNHNWTWDDSGESRVDISAEILDAYLAGVHSLDEELKELNGQVTLHKDRADYYHDLYMKLRNPWINVEERLP